MDGRSGTAGVVYVVRIWIRPDGVEPIMAWLRSHHLADVVAQPGFLWGRCVRLEQVGEDGWIPYVMLYGVESRDALQRYFESPIVERFAEERKPFAEMLRMDRSWGKVELSEDKHG